MTGTLRLGVNIDHVATIRNARGGRHPDPVRAALQAVKAGADCITVHLRLDRRHISEQDIERLLHTLDVPLNLEMAATQETLAVALRHGPDTACLVPEERSELTTEGGLDLIGGADSLRPLVESLQAADIRVTLYIEPEPKQIEAARALGATAVELDTGPYCEAWLSVPDGPESRKELRRIEEGAALAAGFGMECQAGHNLSFETVGPIAAIPSIAELNIGHFLIGEAVFGGLDSAVRRMRAVMDRARASAGGALSA